MRKAPVLSIAMCALLLVGAAKARDLRHHESIRTSDGGCVAQLDVTVDGCMRTQVHDYGDSLGGSTVEFACDARFVACGHLLHCDHSLGIGPMEARLGRAAGPNATDGSRSPRI